MITGFNTDIEYDGVVYHVQTEDKGLETPLILSLVYSGGAILASKRSPYEDLIAAGFDEEKLAVRLKRQHRLICAAINSGRLEDLKRMGRPDGKLEAAPPQAPSVVVEKPVQEPAPLKIEAPVVVEPVPVPVAESPGEPATGPATEPEAVFASLEPSTEPEDIQSLLVSNATDYAALAESTPTPAPAPPPEEVAPPPRRTADNLLYTVHDARRQLPIRNAGKIEKGLVVTILDEEEFRAGQIFNIRVLVENKNEAQAKPLGGVTLSVKILGTSFRPQLYSVKTGRDGVAVISAQIPRFTSGRAAILIRAEADGKALETRRVIHAAL